MAAKFIFSFVVCLLLNFVTVRGLEAVDGRIKITVSLTAGCGDAARFLPDLAEAFSLYKDYLDIEFVSWGRAVRNPDGSLTCQFGVNDCWANRLHRCALKLLDGNLDAQMHYMTCEFAPPRPSFALGSYLCAHAVGLLLPEVDHCVNNHNVEMELEDERIGTQHLGALNNVPGIVFNDVIDFDLHTQALTRLVSMICIAVAEVPNSGVTNCTL